MNWIHKSSFLCWIFNHQHWINMDHKCLEDTIVIESELEYGQVSATFELTCSKCDYKSTVKRAFSFKNDYTKRGTIFDSKEKALGRCINFRGDKYEGE